jgi:hypothetical protein
LAGGAAAPGSWAAAACAARRTGFPAC